MRMCRGCMNYKDDSCFTDKGHCTRCQSKIAQSKTADHRAAIRGQTKKLRKDVKAYSDYVQGK